MHIPAMNQIDIFDTLCANMKVGVPTVIIGEPGGGKTSMIRQAADFVFANLRTIESTVTASRTLPPYLCVLSPNGRDVIDFTGAPRVYEEKPAKGAKRLAGDDGWRTRFARPADLLPESGEGCIMLDEIADANTTMQSVFAGILLDGRAGGHAIGQGWVSIGATNAANHASGAHSLLTKLVNRVCLLTLVTALEPHLEWAVAAGIDPSINAFHRWRPELLHKFMVADAGGKPRPAQGPFPSPRSWENLSRLLATTPERLLLQVANGLVGAEAATEFVAFRKFYLNLPDLKVILDAPDQAGIPTEAPVLWALGGAIAAMARDAQPKQLNNIVSYCRRLSGDFGVKTVLDVRRANKKVVVTPALTEWLKAKPEIRQAILGAVREAA